jgi:hypothetical protein
MISGASFAAMGLGIAFLAAQREPRIVRANVRNGEREVAVVEARRAPAPSRRRGALIGVGVGLLVIGLGVNGFFAALLTGVGHSPVGAYWAVPVVGGLASTAIADYRGDCRNDSCAPFWGLAFADLVLETAAIGLIAYGGWGGSRSRGSAPHVALAPGAAGAPIGATLGGAFF